MALVFLFDLHESRVFTQILGRIVFKCQNIMSSKKNHVEKLGAGVGGAGTGGPRGGLGQGGWGRGRGGGRCGAGGPGWNRGARGETEGAGAGGLPQSLPPHCG